MIEKNNPNQQQEIATRRYYWAKYHSAEETRAFVEGSLRWALVLGAMVPGFWVMKEMGMGPVGWLGGCIVFVIVFSVISFPLTWFVRRRRDNALKAARENGVNV